MKRNRSIILLITLIMTAVLISSCAGSPSSVQTTFTPPIPTRTESPTPLPEATITPDPCSSQNLPKTIGQFNRLMREFDDTSLLAQNTPTQNLAPLITDLQRVRRDAEDYQVPVCLNNLKGYMLNHMNIVIDVLIVSGSKDLKQADPALIQQINQNITVARQYHNQYTLEMASLLGITLVPVTTTPITILETPKP